MIAMRRLMIRGWGVEAGLRVRVIHPAKPQQPRVSVGAAERAAAEMAMLKQIDRQRSEVERRWLEIGGV